MRSTAVTAICAGGWRGVRFLTCWRSPPNIGCSMKGRGGGWRRSGRCYRKKRGRGAAPGPGRRASAYTIGRGYRLGRRERSDKDGCYFAAESAIRQRLLITWCQGRRRHRLKKSSEWQGRDGQSKRALRVRKVKSD